MTRETKQLTRRIREVLESGNYSSGDYLPPIRDLCSKFGVSFETARKGLKSLEQEGLLTSKARQGFRVNTHSAVTSPNTPVAYVTSHLADLGNAQPANWAISQALMMVAAGRGRSTLGIHLHGLSESEILARLATTPISGIILDTLDESLLRLLEKSSACPLVMVNSWFEYASVNVVLQDNYKGGYLAARWLAEAGAERVAWLGPIGEFGHSRERFAGVVAGMASLKRRLSSEMAIEAPFLAMEESARALLARHDRPDGVVAFSKSAAQAIRNAAGAAGLKIGKDLLVVGWTVEDCFESEHYSVFAGGPIPPAIVWSAKEMAQAAMDVLLAPAPATGRRILVPTRLKLTH